MRGRCQPRRARAAPVDDASPCDGPAFEVEGWVSSMGSARPAGAQVELRRAHLPQPPPRHEAGLARPRVRAPHRRRRSAPRLSPQAAPSRDARAAFDADRAVGAARATLCDDGRPRLIIPRRRRKPRQLRAFWAAFLSQLRTTDHASGRRQTDSGSSPGTVRCRDGAPAGRTNAAPAGSRSDGSPATTHHRSRTPSARSATT
jgi:hypothetical protein